MAKIMNQNVQSVLFKGQFTFPSTPSPNLHTKLSNDGIIALPYIGLVVGVDELVPTKFVYALYDPSIACLRFVHGDGTFVQAEQVIFTKHFKHSPSQFSLAYFQHLKKTSAKHYQLLHDKTSSYGFEIMKKYLTISNVVTALLYVKDVTYRSCPALQEIPSELLSSAQENEIGGDGKRVTWPWKGLVGKERVEPLLDWVALQRLSFDMRDEWMVYPRTIEQEPSFFTQTFGPNGTQTLESKKLRKAKELQDRRNAKAGIQINDEDWLDLTQEDNTPKLHRPCNPSAYQTPQKSFPVINLDSPSPSSKDRKRKRGNNETNEKRNPEREEWGKKMYGLKVREEEDDDKGRIHGFGKKKENERMKYRKPTVVSAGEESDDESVFPDIKDLPKEKKNMAGEGKKEGEKDGKKVEEEDLYGVSEEEVKRQNVKRRKGGKDRKEKGRGGGFYRY